MNRLTERIVIQHKYYMDIGLFHLEGERSINQVKHAHHKLEISLVKSGTGKYYIDDEVYDMKQGDIFIINNIELHGIVMGKNESMENLVIHFEPRFVWAEDSNFDSRYLKIFFDRNQQFSHRLDRDNPATIKIRELFAELEEEFIHKPPEYCLMAKVKLLNMLVLLLRHYGYVKEESDADEKTHEIKIINKVTDYIDKNFDRDIKIQELAEIAYMSPAYFSTFFKKYNGITPTEYILRKRVSRAIEYLKATDKTILEIAGLCGFNSTANFNKIFKKVTGVIPSTYR